MSEYYYRIKENIKELCVILIVELFAIFIYNQLGWQWDNAIGWFNIFLIGYIVSDIYSELKGI